MHSLPPWVGVTSPATQQPWRSEGKEKRDLMYLVSPCSDQGFYPVIPSDKEVSLDLVASVKTWSPRPEWGNGKSSPPWILITPYPYPQRVDYRDCIISENVHCGKRAKEQKEQKRYSYLDFSFSEWLTKGSHGPEVIPKVLCFPVRFLFVFFDPSCLIIIKEDSNSGVKVKSKWRMPWGVMALGCFNTTIAW
jgi:hypothetical protein